jgi:transposase
MAIVVGLDVHRAQITFDALDSATGEVTTGRIVPADRATLRRFLRRWTGEQVEAAVEATTGWRFVVEELQRAGAAVQLAEPADTTAARGPKRRAKTDKRDARHLRDLLIERRLLLAWIAPEHILELRALVRLRKTLVDQRTEWLQRIHAVLFHHGVRLAVSRLAVSRLDGRDAHEQLAALDLSPAAQRQITVALAVIAHVNGQLAPLDHDLKAFARAQPGCRALMRHYGIGPQVACAILAELGDTRRFSSSRQSVRFAGLDVTVHESDTKRRAGHLSRQGPPVLRWAAFEAAESACKPASPDHAAALERTPTRSRTRRGPHRRGAKSTSVPPATLRRGWTIQQRRAAVPDLCDSLAWFRHSGSDIHSARCRVLVPRDGSGATESPASYRDQ